MTMGLPYDSKEGRSLCGALTAVMTGIAYKTSAEMAGELGTFPGYKKNAGHMLRVIRNHRRAAHGESRGYEAARRQSGGARPCLLPARRHRHHARHAWDDALALGETNGYRNAQTTVVAPTGTIGLVMDCDTTGIEPDFALVKFRSSPAAATGRSSTRRCRQRFACSAIARARSPRSRPTPSATARCRMPPASTPRP